LSLLVSKRDVFGGFNSMQLQQINAAAAMAAKKAGWKLLDMNELFASFCSSGVYLKDGLLPKPVRH